MKAIFIKFLFSILSGLILSFQISYGQQWGGPNSGQNIWNLNSNNVGIGTLGGPQAKLHILKIGSGIIEALRLENSYSLGNGSSIDFYAGTNKGARIYNYMTNSNTGDIIFAPSNAGTFTDRFTIKGNNGNVGIGLTNPSQKLDVFGNIKVSLGSKIFFTQNSYIQGYEGGGDMEGLKFYTAEGAPLTEHLAIYLTGTGKVGIGHTISANSAYHLDVNGKVRANEIVVNTTGADFVFEDNYKLRNLVDVELFIKENGHLPDIPPANVLVQDGVGIGEMQTKLLQKIEELTLYVIEQDKKIKDLQQIISQGDKNAE